MKLRVWPGRSYPLGATWDGAGVNFALFSEHATAVDLCLFAADAQRETARVPVRERTDQVWHVYLNAHPGVVRFVVPDAHPGVRWEALADTAREHDPAKRRILDVGESLELTGRSLVLLRAC